MFVVQAPVRVSVEVLFASSATQCQRGGAKFFCGSCRSHTFPENSVDRPLIDNVMTCKGDGNYVQQDLVIACVRMKLSE